MKLGPLLGEGKVAEVFEAGADVIKLYRPGWGPEPAQHEAAILEALKLLPLRVPRGLGVVEIDGRWGLLMSRMAGVPLAIQVNMETGAMVGQLADLHRQMHRHSGGVLPRLKGRLADRIGRVSQVSEMERARLLRSLAALQDGDRLCHGDFHPFNIMIDGGEAAIIDWPDATSGSPEADVARTYLLALHNTPALAEPYLMARLPDAAFGREAVMAWLPVLAAARLAENVPDEEQRLLALALGKDDI